MVPFFEIPKLRLSNTRQSRLGITKARELYAHLVHEGKMEAAEFAIVVAVVAIIEHAAGLQLTTEATYGQDGKLAVVVAFAGPHVRKIKQAGVIKHRAFAFRHGLEFGREIREVTHIIA